MRIMGIDGSLSNTGIAVVNNKKVIEMLSVSTNPKDEIEDRIYLLVVNIKELIDKHKPEIVIVEDVFMYINGKTVINLARLNGAILTLCRSLNIKTILYTPSFHKKITSGSGKATKEQTIVEVERYFKIDIPYLLTPTGNVKKKNKIKLKNDNIADALSLCCCYLKTKEGNV